MRNKRNLYIELAYAGSFFVYKNIERQGIVIEKALLNINEFCEYLGVGKTKAREILKTPRNGFSLKIGSKWFVSRDALDKWITEQCQKY